MIPDKFLPAEFLEWFNKEMGARPSDKSLIELYQDVQRAKRMVDVADDLFHQCYRHELAKQVAFHAWLAAKEKEKEKEKK